MTRHHQNMAIAEACGIVSKDQWGPLYKTPQGIVRGCPDYMHDHNAMHEAKLSLSPEDLGTFTCILIQMGVDRNFHFMVATAAEQAEAFLETLNLCKKITK